MKKKAERTKHMNIALTPEENDLLQTKFKATTFHVFSDYIRSVLFNTPVIVRYHNCSLDEFTTVAGGIQGQLDAIRRKFSQAVESQEKQSNSETLAVLLSAQAETTKHIDELKHFFLKIHENVRQDQTLHRDGESPLL